MFDRGLGIVWNNREDNGGLLDESGALGSGENSSSSVGSSICGEVTSQSTVFQACAWADVSCMVSELETAIFNGCLRGLRWAREGSENDGWEGGSCGSLCGAAWGVGVLGADGGGGRAVAIVIDSGRADWSWAVWGGEKRFFRGSQCGTRHGQKYVRGRI